MKNLLQAHSANSFIRHEHELSIAERACKDQIQQHKKNSKAHLQLEIRKLQMSFKT